MFMLISEIFILNFITFRILKVSYGIRSQVIWLFRLFIGVVYDGFVKGVVFLRTQKCAIPNK